MNYLVDGYHGETAAMAPVSARVAFIRRTYAHLAVAIAAFVGIEGALLNTGLGDQLMAAIFRNNVGMLGLLLLFVGGGYLAQYLARSTRSVALQYMGLSMYVLLECVIFLPIMTYAEWKFPGQHLAMQAGGLTLVVFGGLTVAVFASGKDFSFMGPFLFVCSLLAIGFVFAGAVFGFNIGLVFTVAMIALAAGYIIYDTSNIIHQYGTDQHVAASLSLFASVALMFYYILRLFISTRD